MRNNFCLRFRKLKVDIFKKMFGNDEVYDLYNKLGLRSRDFDMWVEGDSVYFTTRGWGHGVGMSQYGANGMAKAGYRYDQILTHYYQGVTIK